MHGDHDHEGDGEGTEGKMEVKWGKRGTGRHSDRKDICISHFEAGFFLKERKFASYISQNSGRKGTCILHNAPPHPPGIKWRKSKESRM